MMKENKIQNYFTLNIIILTLIFLLYSFFEIILNRIYFIYPLILAFDLIISGFKIIDFEFFDSLGLILLIIFMIIYCYLLAALVIYIYITFLKIINQRSLIKGNLNKKFIMLSLLITIFFVLSYTLGLYAISPFGSYISIGDTQRVKLSPLITVSLFPLIFIGSCLEKLGVEYFNLDHMFPFILFIILFIYYFIIVLLIICIYSKLFNKYIILFLFLFLILLEWG